MSNEFTLDLAHPLYSGMSPGDLVAIQGIGGLGHLGIQFAAVRSMKDVLQTVNAHSVHHVRRKWAIMWLHCLPLRTRRTWLPNLVLTTVRDPYC